MEPHPNSIEARKKAESGSNWSVFTFIAAEQIMMTAWRLISEMALGALEAAGKIVSSLPQL